MKLQILVHPNPIALTKATVSNMGTFNQSNDLLNNFCLPCLERLVGSLADEKKKS
jgi:hypothetical protein